MIAKEELSFENQILAAQKLVEILPTAQIKENDYIMVCSSLDSVILTDDIARKLRIGYEILFVEPIYSPNNPECMIAMVSETEEIVVIDELANSFGISLDYIYGESHRKYEEKILKNVYKYRKGKLLEDLKSRNILLVDEGCETGITALTCIKTLSSLGVKSITYATPLIANDVIKSLRVFVDEIYAVHNITNFVDVDFYYKNKMPSRPEIIMSILEESPFYLPLQKEGDKVCNIPLK